MLDTGNVQGLHFLASQHIIVLFHLTHQAKHDLKYSLWFLVKANLTIFCQKIIDFFGPVLWWGEESILWFLQWPASHPGTLDKSPGTKVQFLSSLNYISCIVVISFFQLWPYSWAEMRHLPEASGQSVPRWRRQEIHDNARKKSEAVSRNLPITSRK